MSDNLIERLERLKWMVHCEMRGLIPDTTAYEAAPEIRSLRARLAEAEDVATAAFMAGQAKERVGIVRWLRARAVGERQNARAILLQAADAIEAQQDKEPT